MNEYMVLLALPAFLSEEMAKLIPSQRLHINGLMEKGVVIGYRLSHNRTKLWITMHGKSEDDIMETLRSYPIYYFFENITIEQLMFHNTVTFALPRVSLN